MRIQFYHRYLDLDLVGPRLRNGAIVDEDERCADGRSEEGALGLFLLRHNELIVVFAMNRRTEEKIPDGRMRGVLYISRCL